MKVTCISDLHGYYPILNGGDLLIVGGDLTARDTQKEHLEMLSWLGRQDYKKKVFIAGNHDNFLQHTKLIPIEDLGIEYLYDSGTEFEGIKIWGSPWSLWFSGVNPVCKAFMDSETHLERKFKKIPDNTDILITHTPPYGILDKNEGGASCGSVSLLKHLDRVKPKLHVFGHIHEQGGGELLYKHIKENTWCANCSYVNERYKPVNKPYEFEL
jgi:Icc-related predicted phosphoesterase